MPESVAARGGSPVDLHDSLLRVRGLGKRFGRHVVLDDVDLVVNAGELVALVGENGAGKSTLVRCVAGDLSADSGTIELVDDCPPAIVWQDLALCENLDATTNLFLGQEIGMLWMADSDMELKAKVLLDGLGIDLPDLRRPVGLLSGGQRQSLAIARALVGRPRLLILDEPTASLGVLETRAVERVMLGLRAAGCGLLLISHRIEQVFGIADRVVVLRHGRVVADRPTMELHPDDVVSLIAGIDAETTARKQMERLRSLVDQLAARTASFPPSSSAASCASASGSRQMRWTAAICRRWRNRRNSPRACSPTRATIGASRTKREAVAYGTGLVAPMWTSWPGVMPNAGPCRNEGRGGYVDAAGAQHLEVVVEPSVCPRSQASRALARRANLLYNREHAEPVPLHRAGAA